MWEGWECSRFSGFELRVCFSLGSGFGEFSSWGNLVCQTEPQLKQKSCLFWLQMF